MPGHDAVNRVIVALLAAALAVGGCGGSSPATTTSKVVTRSQSSTATTSPTTSTTTSTTAKPKPRPPSYPRLLGAARGSGPTPFVPAMSWQGQTAAWVARSASGVALLSFDQRLVRLDLHSGTADAGPYYRYGPVLATSETRRAVAGFNGGFRLSTGAGGFVAYGRVAVPLRDGLGSIVTYTDGTTDIGAWHQGVPAAGKQVASVRQNLTLLIDHGSAASSVGCVSCWGATLGGVSATARSALGITADGRLIWAGGERLLPADLARALLGARVVRAVELDINPEWVAAYLYGHRGGSGPLAPVPIVPGQPGIPGQLLLPYSRDFFVVVAR